MRRKVTLPGLALGALLLGAGCGEEKTCAADQRLCAGACVALQSDPRNCGACGQACGSGQGCSSGACVDCAAAPGLCTTAVMAACFNLDQLRPIGADLAPSGPPLATGSGPSSLARGGDALYVANDLSSSISTVTLAPPPATVSGAPLSVSSASAGFSDLPRVAVHQGLLWASNAATNTLVVIDPATGAAVDEVALPPAPFGANPQGIGFVGAKAYLALNGLDAVAVLDVSRIPGARLQPALIDLAPLAPGGARAMPAQVLPVGERVYVSLNALGPSFAPVAGGNGRLAVIDTATDAALAPVDLGAGCLNPSGMALLGTTLWVACGFHTFQSSDVTGGALVPVELATGTPVVRPPVALPQHAAASLAFCDGRGYAGATESGTVIAFDPASGTVSSSAVVCPAEPGKASFVADVACAR